MAVAGQNRSFYRRLVESERVEVAVGTGTPPEIYRLPIELLRERSTFFRALLGRDQERDVVRCEVLSATSEATFDAFFAWIMEAEPRLDKRDSVEEMIKLAVLAEHLGVWRLSNQVADSILLQDREGAWKWSQEALHAVYGQAKEGGALRRLAAATILSMDKHPPIFARDEEDEDRAWDEVFLAHAAMGRDYWRAKKTEECSRYVWGKATDPCQYHMHPWVGADEDGSDRLGCDGCPYADRENYPCWEMVEEVVEEAAPLEEAVDDVVVYAIEDAVEENAVVDDAVEDAVVENAVVDEVVEDAPLEEDNHAEAVVCHEEPVAEIEVDAPPLTLRAIKAEISGLSGRDRQELKKWVMRKGWKEEEGVSDGWVEASV